MSWILTILRKVGLAPRFTEEDMLDAEFENSVFDHAKVVEEAKSVVAERRASNEMLRSVLETARSRTASFEEFEAAIRKEGDRDRDEL